MLLASTQVGPTLGCGARCLQSDEEAIRQAAMRGGACRVPAGRQQNRPRRADSALVREQHVVGTAAVAEMLVDVYNRLA